MALSRRQWIVMTVAMLGVLANTSTYGVLAPFYPKEARLKDNSNFQIGVVFSAYAVLGFFSSPIVGYLLSTGVSSKVILVTGIFIGGGFFAVMGLLHRVLPGTPFFIANLACRLVQTFGASTCSTCFYSIVAAELPNYRNIAIATLEMTFGLGMMLGPALGGVLYELGGYPLPCYVFGGLACVVGVVAVVCLPRTELPDTPIAKINWRAIDIQLIFDMLATNCALSIMNYNDVSLSSELEAYGMSQSRMGLVFLICAMVYAVSSMLWGSCVRRVGDSRYLVVAGALIAALGVFLMRPVEKAGVKITLPLQIGAQSLLGLGMSAMYVCSTLHGMHYAVHRLGFSDDISTHGFISGIFMASMFSGCFIGPIVGGLLSDAFGYATTLEVGTYWVLATASCVIFGLCTDRPRRNETPRIPSKDEQIIIRTTAETAKNDQNGPAANN
ncbi:MFS-type transporter SLC18B1-like [Tropilaelaps mercedesae]|uniref:MFS-type transporter SLC18B1-like n=1 Tax=Tropilaelaps mercedesae TaxID=418985 RepID=A0A1V9XUU2_9ACAR|nr:MFS-type transporter SLC18B1-like [Tropilaelaps mercedesae]